MIDTGNGTENSVNERKWIDSAGMRNIYILRPIGSDRAAQFGIAWRQAWMKDFVCAYYPDRLANRSKL
ncbi:MAG: hypothetical protein IT171_08445 [Acidobacteria bacterium]|nr:hypothetical protein [Acidobacteriota bacterium]